MLCIVYDLVKGLMSNAEHLNETGKKQTVVCASMLLQKTLKILGKGPVDIISFNLTNTCQMVKSVGFSCELKRH